MRIIGLTFSLIGFLTYAGFNHLYAQTLHRFSSGTTQTLHSVWFPTDSTGYIVGDLGVISITTDGGNSWSLQPSGVNLNFYTQFFTDSANGAFAGDNGTIYTVLQDNPPIKVSLPESNAIYGMTFPSYDTGIVCGANGLVYMTIDSGKSWNKKTLAPGLQKSTFYDADYFDDDTYWIAGQTGQLYYTSDDGANWGPVPIPNVRTPTIKNLYSIYFPADGSETGWVVGDETLAFTTDGGDTWTSIPTTDSLRFVSGWDSTDAYAVGLHGAILYTTDRSHWSSLPSGTTANLYGFDYTDDWLYFVGDSGLILTTLPSGSPSLVSNSSSGLTQSVTLECRNNSILLTYPTEWTDPLRMEIYNELGMRVQVYEIQPMQKSQQCILPSGVYFYRLMNGNSSKSGKFFVGN